MTDINNDRELLAQWMIRHSFATGHGDTVEDLLAELEWQVIKLRHQLDAARRMPDWADQMDALAEAVAEAIASETESNGCTSFVACPFGPDCYCRADARIAVRVIANALEAE